MSKRAPKKSRNGGDCARTSDARRQRVKAGFGSCYYDSIMSTDGIDRYGGLPYDLRVWANNLFQVPQDSVFGGEGNDSLDGGSA